MMTDLNQCELFISSPLDKVELFSPTGPEPKSYADVVKQKAMNVTVPVTSTVTPVPNVTVPFTSVPAVSKHTSPQKESVATNSTQRKWWKPRRKLFKNNHMNPTRAQKCLNMVSSAIKNSLSRVAENYFPVADPGVLKTEDLPVASTGIITAPTSDLPDIVKPETPASFPPPTPKTHQEQLDEFSSAIDTNRHAFGFEFLSAKGSMADKIRFLGFQSVMFVLMLMILTFNSRTMTEDFVTSRPFLDPPPVCLLPRLKTYWPRDVYLFFSDLSTVPWNCVASKFNYYLLLTIDIFFSKVYNFFEGDYLSRHFHGAPDFYYSYSIPVFASFALGFMLLLVVSLKMNNFRNAPMIWTLLSSVLFLLAFEKSISTSYVDVIIDYDAASRASIIHPLSTPSSPRLIEIIYHYHTWNPLLSLCLFLLAPLVLTFSALWPRVFYIHSVTYNDDPFDKESRFDSASKGKSVHDIPLMGTHMIHAQLGFVKWFVSSSIVSVELMIQACNPNSLSPLTAKHVVIERLDRFISTCQTVNVPRYSILTGQSVYANTMYLSSAYNDSLALSRENIPVLDYDRPP